MLRRIHLVPAVLTALVLLAVPSVGQAKTFTFGTRLDHEPSNSAPGHNCREDGSDDPTPACTRVGIDKGDAVPAGLRAPATGTIVAFRVRAGAPSVATFRVVRLAQLGFKPALNDFTGLGKGVGFGPTVHIKGKGFAEAEVNAVETFPAHVRVKKGDYVGIDSTSTAALYCSGGGNNQIIFSPKVGATYRKSAHTEGCELLVQAVMVPDAPKKKNKS